MFPPPVAVAITVTIARSFPHPRRVAWTQSNPPRLASRLWFTHYYMRAGVEGMGEGAYCLTQLASALEFASHADASVLADISEDELTEVM